MSLPDVDSRSKVFGQTSEPTMGLLFANRNGAPNRCQGTDLSGQGRRRHPGMLMKTCDSSVPGASNTVGDKAKLMTWPHS